MIKGQKNDLSLNNDRDEYIFNANGIVYQVIGGMTSPETCVIHGTRAKKRYNWLISQGIDKLEAFVLHQDAAKVRAMREKVDLEAGIIPVKRIPQVEEKMEPEMLARFKWFRDQGYTKEESKTYARQETITLTGFDESCWSTNLLLMTVAPKDYPKTVLTEEQAKEIKTAVLKQAVQQKEQEPHFKQLAFFNGYLLIECCDEHTRYWLRKTVHGLEISKDMMPLNVVPLKLLIKSKVFLSWFVSSADHSNTDILKIVESQNDRISTSDWKVVNRKKIGKKKTIELMLTVDPDSAKTIKQLDGVLNYKSTKVKLDLQRVPLESNLPKRHDKWNASSSHSSFVKQESNCSIDDFKMDHHDDTTNLNVMHPFANGSRVRIKRVHSPGSVRNRDRSENSVDTDRRPQSTQHATSNHKTDSDMYGCRSRLSSPTWEDYIHQQIHRSDKRSNRSTESRQSVHDSRNDDYDAYASDEVVRRLSTPTWEDHVHQQMQRPNKRSIPSTESRQLVRGSRNDDCDAYVSGRVVDRLSTPTWEDHLHQQIQRPNKRSNRSTERRPSGLGDPIGSAYASSFHITDHFDQQSNTHLRDPLYRDHHVVSSVRVDRSPNRRMDHEAEVEAPGPPRWNDIKQRTKVRLREHDSDHHSITSSRSNHYDLSSPHRDHYESRRIIRNDVSPSAFNRASIPPQSLNNDRLEIKRSAVFHRDLFDNASSRNESNQFNEDLHLKPDRALQGASKLDDYGQHRDNRRVTDLYGFDRHERISFQSGRTQSNSAHLTSPARRDSYDYDRDHQSMERVGKDRHHEERFHRSDSIQYQHASHSKRNKSPGHRGLKDNRQPNDRLQRKFYSQQESAIHNDNEQYKSRRSSSVVRKCHQNERGSTSYSGSHRRY